MLEKHESIELSDLGSFFIRGREVRLAGLPSYEVVFAKGGSPAVVDPNGEFEAGQMYVQYYHLANPKHKYPVLMWHGGGLTGATWETTPDGRAGWSTLFLRHGYSVYISDSVERGRSSWARYPEIYTTEPQFRTKQQAWDSFRFGKYSPDAAKRTATKGMQFPVEAFDTFMLQAVPRWTSNDAITEEAYLKYMRKVGKSVILAHSQGAGYALQVAVNAPELVKAVIAVESSGIPTYSKDCLKALRDTPHLFVWGDLIHGSGTWWEEYYRNVKKYSQDLQEAGVPVTWMELPKIGIKGNSHMLMMDKNSHEIAKKILDWLDNNS